MRARGTSILNFTKPCEKSNVILYTNECLRIKCDEPPNLQKRPAFASKTAVTVAGFSSRRQSYPGPESRLVDSGPIENDKHSSKKKMMVAIMQRCRSKGVDQRIDYAGRERYEKGTDQTPANFVQSRTTWNILYIYILRSIYYILYEFRRNSRSRSWGVLIIYIKLAPSTSTVDYSVESYAMSYRYIGRETRTFALHCRASVGTHAQTSVAAQISFDSQLIGRINPSRVLR